MAQVAVEPIWRLAQEWGWWVRDTSMLTWSTTRWQTKGVPQNSDNLVPKWYPPPISKLQERSINPGLTWLEGFIIVFATSCASCHFITWIVVLRLGIVLNYLVFYVACSMEWSAWNPKFCWCYSSFLFVKAEQNACKIHHGCWWNTYLVGGFKHFVFFHSVGDFIIPTVTHSMIFQRGRAQPLTSICYIYI